MATFIHIFWNLTLSLVQCQRLEILPTLGLYIPFSLTEKGKLCQTCWGYLQNPEVKHTMDYEKKEVLKRLMLRSAQDFTTPWKHACVTAKIFHCEKYVSRFPHQTGSSSHLHSTHKCYTAVSWWISCLLTWFQLVSNQHNTVNFFGWLGNIPLKYANKHELQALCWRLSYKCNISAVGLYSYAIFFFCHLPEY